MNRNAKAFVQAASDMFGAGAHLSRDDIQKVVDERGVPFPYWFVTKQEYRADRGVYRLPALPDGKPITNTVVETTEQPETIAMAQTATVHVLRQKKLHDDSDTAIPEKFPGFVPFGFYKDLTNIVQSKLFYPVFITGLSGNGKTLMVEQVCAVLGRECIRVNISIETDESDLIGSNTKATYSLQFFCMLKNASCYLGF